MTLPTQREVMVHQLNAQDQELHRSGPGVPQSPRQRPLVRLRFMLIILALAALVTVAMAGWRDLYSGFLEPIAPTIAVEELPRGIGLAPVSLKLSIQDEGAGLDEIVVRVRQRDRTRELLRKSLNGRKHESLTLDFSGDPSVLEEGLAELEIKAFDRALWSNSGSLDIPLKVDYRRPRIEVLSTQHNARQGGSQLVFYRASDDNIGASGVRVGNQVFYGFPARNLDKAFDDPNLYIAIYAIDTRLNPETIEVKAFAEDQVGNAASVGFYNKIQKRGSRRVDVRLSDEYLRQEVLPIAELNYPKFAALLQGDESRYRITQPASTELGLIQRLLFVNDILRPANDGEIVLKLKDPRFERMWDSALERPIGSVRYTFDDRLKFLCDKDPCGTLTQPGWDLDLPRDNSEVRAVSDGFVVFAENFGAMGQSIAIDHGLGLASIYSNLSSISVSKGDQVTRGQTLGKGQRGGFAGNTHTNFELRVQGVPVDPGEFMDRGWFDSHITGKINEMKTLLGIPVYRKL